MTNPADPSSGVAVSAQWDTVYGFAPDTSVLVVSFTVKGGIPGGDVAAFKATVQAAVADALGLTGDDAGRIVVLSAEDNGAGSVDVRMAIKPAPSAVDETGEPARSNDKLFKEYARFPLVRGYSSLIRHVALCRFVSQTQSSSSRLRQGALSNIDASVAPVSAQCQQTGSGNSDGFDLDCSGSPSGGGGGGGNDNMLYIAIGAAGGALVLGLGGFLLRRHLRAKPGSRPGSHKAKSLPSVSGASSEQGVQLHQVTTHVAGSDSGSAAVPAVI